MKLKKIQYVFKPHFFCLVLFCLFPHLPLLAEMVNNPELGCMLDLPEGFTVIPTRKSTRKLYQHTMMPVGLQIALYPYRQFPTVEAAANHIFLELSAQKKAIRFLLQGNPALVAHLQFAQNKQRLAGWLLVQPLAEQKGWLVLLTSTQAEEEQKYEPMMISCLDALFTSRQSYLEPGPMIQAVYPKEGSVTKKVRFDKKTLTIHFDRSDFEANQALIDREFSVLTYYLNSPLPLLQKAWQRYYRLIYRDSLARCRNLALVIEKELISVNGEGALPEADYIASSLLEWMQGFTYTRNRNGSDFLNIPAVCAEQSGDCDSRALLLSVLLQHFNIKSILMITPNHEAKHAVAAIDCAGKGARFTHKGTRYLIAETTAKVPLGNIAQDLADPSLWFAVDWYTLPTDTNLGVRDQE